MAAKPVVLPDTFTGEASWDEWFCHFENVSDVNGWDDDQKLKFLKVRLMERAQKAFQHLNDDVRANYDETKRALMAHFEPESKKTRYQSKFQCQRKWKMENWADYAEDLRAVADRQGVSGAARRSKRTSGVKLLPQPARTSTGHLRCQTETARDVG